jgi:dTMP kinase
MTKRFITVEGTEGAGKSTSLEYMRSWFQERGIEPLMTREPGGTPLAEQIRDLLLSHREETVASDAELLLMYAARVQHTEAVIKPALADGRWVISDRYNDASFAYQGTARGLGMERLQALDDWSLQGFKPQLTLFFDLPVEVGMARAGKRSDPDRFEKESMAFFERVREGYLARAEAEPDRFVIIDSNQTIKGVQQQIARVLETRLDV